MKQISFWKTPKKYHGGGEGAGKRKGARPIALKQPMFLTFRSTCARGAWNFLRFAKPIEETLQILARRHRVRVYGFRNVGNHLHVTVRARSRRELQNFLRVFPQAVAFLVTGTRKGRAIGKFWDQLVHSRVVNWGRDWLFVRQYLEKNGLEAAGVPREIADRLYKGIRAAL